MTFPTSGPASLAIFCKVVDNYGDVGICWRLARQLRHEHALAVTLWVDDLPTFQRICPQVDTGAADQQVLGVRVRHWCGQDGVSVADEEANDEADEVADIVIEFFGCDIPPAYIAAMARRAPRPVWLNLEGLSAEEWVEGCHRMPSMHPRLPLTKHFFFPGYTANTGGLLRETALEQQRQRFLADGAGARDFLAQFGVTSAEAASLKVSLFCYPHAPVAALFDTWQGAPSPLTCLVPEGVARADVEAFLGGPASAGAVHTRGALTLRVLPFVAQPDYDKLLWSCDLNFVRGEDSWVRAQWAGKPFVWHIYPQDDNLHHKKLRAFLQRYAATVDALDSFTLAWNGVGTIEPAGWPALWQMLAAQLPAVSARAAAWQGEMQAHGDLAANLVKFAHQLSTRAEINVKF